MPENAKKIFVIMRMKTNAQLNERWKKKQTNKQIRSRVESPYRIMTCHQNESIVLSLRIMVARGDTASLHLLKNRLKEYIYNKETNYNFKYKAKCARWKLFCPNYVCSYSCKQAMTSLCERAIAKPSIKYLMVHPMQMFYYH